MATTVVDSLILQLGLDPSQLDRSITSAFNRITGFRTTATTEASTIEHVNKIVTFSIEQLGGSFLKLFAGFLSFEAVKALMNQFTAADAASTHLAHVLQIPLETLKAWEGAISRFQGNAGEFSGAISNIEKGLARWQMFGERPEWAEMLSRLMPSGNLDPFHMSSMNILLTLIDKVHGMKPSEAAVFLQSFGITDYKTIDFLLKGREYVLSIVQDQAKLNHVNQEGGEAAIKRMEAVNRLNSAIEGLERRFVNILAPAQIKVIEGMIGLVSAARMLEGPLKHLATFIVNTMKPVIDIINAFTGGHAGQTELPEVESGRTGGSIAGPADTGRGGGSGANVTPSHASGNVDQALVNAANATGMDVNTLRAVADIESSNNPNSNANNSRQYKGLMQLNQQELDQHGGGNIFNPFDNALAAARIMKENLEWFKSKYGRDPSPGELYLMHLQGRGFFSGHIMTNAGGNLPPNFHGELTYENFKAGWEARVNSARSFYANKFANGKPSDNTVPYLDLSTRYQLGQLSLPGTGARVSAQANSAKYVTKVDATVTHVPHVTVNTPSTDVEGIAQAIHTELQKQKPASTIDQRWQ